MMTYLEFRSKLGAAAHEAATRQYIAQRSGRHLFHHDKLRVPNPPRDFSVRKVGGLAPIGNAILRKDLNDPYLGVLIMCLQTRRDPAWPLEYSEPGKARQPDLACIELHEVYEIKPDDPQQINDGRQQLVEFINLLGAGDREWGTYIKNSANTYGSTLGRQTAGLTWNRGLSFRPQPATVAIPGLGEVAITYRSGEAGIIVWHTNSERERIPEPAMVAGKELRSN
ncbi:MAG: hypothetical protein JWO52_2582 [Gammaproteobacteria bacterium]|jgi:hypothetical protein|nr:hypothetical protein [Gammaproteobacteria bacterium]